MFKILVYYIDEDAMHKYIESFLSAESVVRIERKCNITTFEGPHVEITCIHCPRISVSEHGRRAHITAVQEELTWSDDWPKIRDYIIRPMVLTQIDIQVFDGITREEDAA